ncbi:hypothetical protein CPB84DRAFT_1672351 [Gymnopilus junonius]|uniref:Uncharacterized protein n=1 Tax=Gymnopilus junonius TaxID=109634 RepID=A0A9P5P031_GYMJU|nr:hypothetical protein CPB84DRAFT_1672351 [Gymnopilus junonius]
MWLEIKSLAPATFVKYLKDYWLTPRWIKMWPAIYSKQTCSSKHKLFIPFHYLICLYNETRWHHVLKGKFFNGWRNRHLDHLISTLVIKVVPYYILRWIFYLCI